MRTWRKVHASILDSEQVAQLSDGAIVLLTFLIVAQDDTGFYPWTDTKVRRLIATRPKWSLKKARIYVEEIISAKIAHWEDGGIVLDNGEKLNGKPRSDVAELRYQREIDDPTYTPRIQPVPTAATPTYTALQPAVCARVEKSREEESREEERSTSPPFPPAAAAHSPPNSFSGNKPVDLGYSVQRVSTAFARKFGAVLPDRADAEIAVFLSRASPVPLQMLFDAIEEAAQYTPDDPWAYTKAIIKRQMESRKNGDKPEQPPVIDPDKYVQGQYGHVVQRGLDPPADEDP